MLWVVTFGQKSNYPSFYLQKFHFFNPTQKYQILVEIEKFTYLISLLYREEHDGAICVTI
jgi:hypothetical protein